jgi:energy-coupling factor transport system substrate-specific component
MGEKLVSVKTVVAIGIGSALMFVLMRFVAVPSGIPNTNLNLGIAVLSLFAAIFGPIAGFLVGFIGHFLTDLTFGWGVWWTWVIADALYGLAVGFFWKLYKIEEGEFDIMQVLIFNGVQIVANLLAWVAIAPTLDIIIYQEPSDKVYLQGLIAGALNIGVVLILGTILAFGYSRTRTKADSLKAE